MSGDNEIPRNFGDRIGYRGTLAELAAAAAAALGLPEPAGAELVRVGYEDFNFILTAGESKRLVKIFGAFRSDAECQRYIDVVGRVVAAGVATPKLAGPGIVTFNAGGAALRASAFEYVNGTDLFRAEHTPSRDEAAVLGRQAAMISLVPMQPAPVEDSWAITGFPAAYAEKSGLLSAEDRALVEPLVGEFSRLEIESLPKSFVHGDIITTNVVRDGNGELWIVDFAVSNYYPRIQELAVLASDICFDPGDVAQTRFNFRAAIAAHMEYARLTEQELRALPVYVLLAHAMHLLCATFEERTKGNTTAENAYFLRRGREGLRRGIAGV